MVFGRNIRGPDMMSLTLPLTPQWLNELLRVSDATTKDDHSGQEWARKPGRTHLGLRGTTHFKLACSSPAASGASGDERTEADECNPCMAGYDLLSRAHVRP